MYKYFPSFFSSLFKITVMASNSLLLCKSIQKSQFHWPFLIILTVCRTPVIGQFFLSVLSAWKQHKPWGWYIVIESDVNTQLKHRNWKWGAVTIVFRGFISYQRNSLVDVEMTDLKHSFILSINRFKLASLFGFIVTTFRQLYSTDFIKYLLFDARIFASVQYFVSYALRIQRSFREFITFDKAFFETHWRAILRIYSFR